MKTIKNRYGAESDLTLRVEITESTFSVEDVTGQGREKDFLKLQDVIKDLNRELGSLPKQGQIVDEGMRRGFAKSDVFDLLRDGEGQYWNVTGKKPKLYAVI